VKVEKLADGIYFFDLYTFNVAKMGACYVIVDDKITVVETGPATSEEFLWEGLKIIGVAPKDVSYIAITHIHLDHSGGAGYVLDRMPNAKVLVSTKGVKHLVDPSKLYASATMVYKEETKTRFGDVLPVPRDRIIGMETGDKVVIGEGRELVAYYTPGHAPHHLAFHDTKTNGLFCGEALGLYFPDVDYFSPSTAPPSFSLEDIEASIAKVLEINPDILYFAHFGPNKDIKRCCEEMLKKVRLWVKITEESLKAGLTKKEITQRLVDLAIKEMRELEKQTPESLKHYLSELTNFTVYRIETICASGVIKYVKDKRL
jgi:glyoxylase-like metal-dependent hydrolase (beta-lactamase superfamily II)